MSGTSMDAVDAVLLDFGEHSIQIIAYRQFPIAADIRRQVKALDGSASLADVSELDAVMGELFAGAVQRLLQESGVTAAAIAAIGSHGQTVLHLPGARHPRSWQIGDPTRIAATTGITTVADFRRMDIAAGGEGAPLAPGFHAWLFGPLGGRRVILNIGGMANLTILDGQQVTGFDSGPGNALLDDWTRLHLEQDFDADGQWAASGQCQDELLSRMLAEPYFTRPPPKSTGRDEFHLGWLRGVLALCSGTPQAADVQATLLELSARTISTAVREHAGDTEEILVCGGGCHNAVLMRRLALLLDDMEMGTTEKYGLDPDAVEAVAFAWLARQRLDGKPGNVPAVTGAREAVVLGGVYRP